MTNKLLSEAGAQLLLENPSKADAILERIKKLISAKYRSISWPQLCQKMIEIVAQKTDTKIIEVSSAQRLADTELDNITKALRGNISLSQKIDESLGAGIIIKQDQKILDLSLRGKIEKIKTNIKE